MLNPFRQHRHHSLDSIAEDDEADKDAYCPVQVPHLGLLLEDLGADEDRESHDASHQRVESCKDK